MTDTRDIDRAALVAMDRHERLLHAKNLELLLGSMVRRSGVDEVKKMLLWYVSKLEEF